MSNDLHLYLREAARPLDANAQAFLHVLDRGVRFAQKRLLSTPEPWDTEPPNFLFEYVVGGVSRVVTLPWSMNLDAQLFSRAVQMDLPEDEAARGGAHLLFLLKAPDAVFGKDFTGACLSAVLMEKFGSIPMIHQALSEVHVLPPQQGEAYQRCTYFLRHSIDGMGNSFVLQLRYSPEVAGQILVGAIWTMLDKRYLLSARALLGGR